MHLLVTYVRAFVMDLKESKKQCSTAVPSLRSFRFGLIDLDVTSAAISDSVLDNLTNSQAGGPHFASTK